VFITPYTPHLTPTPPPRYADALRHRKAPRTLAFDESDVSDKPSWIRALPPLSDYDVKRMNRLYRHRRRSMLGVEDLVRTVLAALRSTAQLERTYVLFASDNGFHMGQHRLRAGKNTAYEEDIRVPLVVIGPGVLAGRVVYEMTANVDFAPTFAEMAGAAVPRYVDGRSFLPLLLGRQPASWRRALLLEHKQGSTSSEASTIATNSLLEPPDPHDLQSAISGDAPDYAGVRTESQLSYIEYATGERELYDLAKDPAQLNNIYATATPKLRVSLSRWLETLRGTAGETLRAAEEAPPP
jgi:arylsulfatase A-like enzyme